MLFFLAPWRSPFILKSSNNLVSKYALGLGLLGYIHWAIYITCIGLYTLFYYPGNASFIVVVIITIIIIIIIIITSDTGKSKL